MKEYIIIPAIIVYGCDKCPRRGIDGENKRQDWCRKKWEDEGRTLIIGTRKTIHPKCPYREVNI
jgi:hypothetical protein